MENLFHTLLLVTMILPLGNTEGTQPSTSRPVSRSRRNRILSTNSEDEFFVGKSIIFSATIHHKSQIVCSILSNNDLSYDFVGAYLHLGLTLPLGLLPVVLSPLIQLSAKNLRMLCCSMAAAWITD